MAPRGDSLPALGALVLAACAVPPAPPVFDLTPPPPAAPAAAASDACARAARHRARAPKLLAEGRLDRAIRVLAFADKLCPATAGEGEADRKAARAELDAPPPPGGGEALYDAGLAAKAGGRSVEAQRLFDRAMTALEREARAAGVESPRVALEVQNGISDSIEAAAWGRIDGSAYLAVAHEKAVSIFDAATWYERRELRHPDDVSAIAVSPDGKRLATAASDAARLWDVASGKEILKRELPHGHAAWSRDGRVLACGDGQSLEIWRSDVPGDLPTLPGGPSPVRVIEIPTPRGRPAASRIEEIAVSARGEVVAVGHEDGSVSAWRGSDGKALWRVPAHKARVQGLAVSPDGKRVASSATDGIKLWEGTRGTAVRELSRRHASTVAWSPDGATVVASHGGGLQAWSAATGKETFEAAGLSPHSVAFDAEGKTIAGVGLGKIFIWDAGTGQEQHRVEPHAEAIQSVAWIAGGERFVSGGWDDTVRVWDGRRGAPLRTMTGDESVLAVAPSPDAALIAAGYTGSKTVIWSAATGEKLHTFEGTGGWNSAAAFSRSGKLVALASDKTVTLLEVGSWREKRTFGPAPGEVTSVALSPDERVLAAGARDSAVHLWETGTGQDLGSLVLGNTVSGLAFRADGGVLLAGANEALLLDPTGGPKILQELSGHTGYVSTVAFGPGDNRVASGSSDRAIRLFDARSGDLVRKIDGHTALVNAVAFRPDGQWLLSGSDDGSIRLWSLETGASLVIRTVTHTEDAYAFTSGAEGQIELFGEAGRAFPACRIGAAVYRFDLCRERVEARGLAAKVLAGDASALEP